MSETFPAHGAASFAIRGRIVAIYVKGPWNAELVSQVHADLQMKDGDLQSCGWGVMVVVQGSALFGPDVVDTIRSIAANQTATMGRVATAWVLPSDVEGATIMPKIIRDLYGGSDRIEIFEQTLSAEAWLNDRIARASGI